MTREGYLGRVGLSLSAERRVDPGHLGKCPREALQEVKRFHETAVEAKP